ncbi:hypothetical protein KAR48_15045 [bacterium]|nr:hypothetical protein [bacterium]
MNTRRIVIPVLILFSVVIWGHNLYRILHSPKNDESLEYIPFSSKQKKQIDVMDIAKTVFVYQGKKRDPFRPYLNHRNNTPSSSKKKLKAAKKIVPEVKPPQFRYLGLIKSDDGPLAIIEAVSGKTDYVKAGDEWHACQIKAISREAIQFVFNKKCYEIFRR